MEKVLNKAWISLNNWLAPVFCTQASVYNIVEKS